MAKLIVELDDDIRERYEDVAISSAGRQLLLEAQNLRLLRSLLILGEQIMANFEDLKAAVAAEKTVVDSVSTLLKGIAERLKNNPSPEEVAAVIADIEAQSQELSEAAATVPS